MRTTSQTKPHLLFVGSLPKARPGCGFVVCVSGRNSGRRVPVLATSAVLFLLLGQQSMGQESLGAADRAAYVAVAMNAGTPIERIERTVIAHLSTQLVRERPQLTADEISRVMDTYQNAFDGILRDGEGNFRVSKDVQVGSGVINSLLNVAKEVELDIPLLGDLGTGVLAAGLQETMYQSVVFYEHLHGPIAQFEAKDTIAGLYEFTRRLSEQTWRERWDLARSHAGLREATDRTVGNAIDAFIGDTAAEILERSALSLPPGLRLLLLSSRDTMLASVDELKEFSKDEFEVVREQIAELIRKNAGRREDLAREQADHERQIELQQLAAAKSAVFVAQEIARMTHNPELARQISVGGHAAIQILDSLSQFEHTRASGFAGLGTGMSNIVSSLTLAGNLIGVVATVASLFEKEDSRPSIEEIILEHIIALRRQIHEFREAMVDRLDSVDEQLDDIYHDLVVSFERVEGGIAAIRGSLYDISARLARLEANIYEYLEVGFRRDFEEDVVYCLGNWPIYGEIDRERHEYCSTNFFVWATRHAQDSLSTGGTSRSYEAEDVIEELTTKPFATNVRYLFEFAERHGWLDVSVGQAVNPVVWRTAAEAFADLLIRAAHITRELPPAAVIARTDQVIAAGREIEWLIERARNRAFFDQLFAFYAEKADELYATVNEAISVHALPIYTREWRKARERTWPVSVGSVVPNDADGERVRVLGDPSPCPIPDFQAIATKLPDLGRVVRELPSPPVGFEAYVPLEYKVAVYMGLGSFRASYLTPYWGGLMLATSFNLGRNHPLVVQGYTQFLLGDLEFYYALEFLGPETATTIDFRRYYSPLHVVFAGRRSTDDQFDILLDLRDELPVLWGSAKPVTGRRSWEDPCQFAWARTHPVVKDEFYSDAWDFRPSAEKQAQNVAVARSAVQKIWREEFRSEIYDDTVSEFTAAGSNVERAARELTGAARLIESFVRLVFSRTLRSDDRWASLLYGRDRVPDGEMVASWFSAHARLEDIAETIDARVDELDALVDESLVNGPPDPYRTVSETLTRLRNARMFIAKDWFPGQEDLALSTFKRGDSNGDGTVDVSDAIATIGVLFLGQGEITCRDAWDSNDDSLVDISDAINSLGVLFLGRGSIPLPGVSECGVDPTGDELDCEQYEVCS